jgi:hypothetical protein
MGTCIAIVVGNILDDQGIAVLVLARVLPSLYNVQNGAQHAIRLKFLANKLRNLGRWAEHSLTTYFSLITPTGRSLPLLSTRS